MKSFNFVVLCIVLIAATANGQNDLPINQDSLSYERPGLSVGIKTGLNSYLLTNEVIQTVNLLTPYIGFGFEIDAGGLPVGKKASLFSKTIVSMGQTSSKRKELILESGPSAFLQENLLRFEVEQYLFTYKENEPVQPFVSFQSIILDGSEMIFITYQLNVGLDFDLSEKVAIGGHLGVGKYFTSVGVSYRTTNNIAEGEVNFRYRFSKHLNMRISAIGGGSNMGAHLNLYYTF